MSKDTREPCNSLTPKARWLLYKGKAAKAERALNKIHGEADHHEMIVQEQLAILNKSREKEAEAWSGESKGSDLWSEYRPDR